MKYLNYAAIIATTAVVTSACRAQSTPATNGNSMEQAVTLVTSTGTLYGTLELPHASGPTPVVLIIAGSGPTDRNGNSRALPGQNNSLKMLADGLAANGIASVRYDKRGIAESVGAMTKEEDLRFDNYVADAEGWLKQLRADKRFSTVSVVGHSEGSLIGMIAAREAGADGFVSLEGAGRKASAILNEQLSAQLPPEMLATSKHIMALIDAGAPADTTTVPAPLAPLFRPSVRPYLVSWFKYDPAVELGKLKVPALIVQGTTDIQTSVTDAKALSTGNAAAKYVEIQGMNHVLKNAPPGRLEQMSTYSDPSLPVVPKLIDEVSAFVKSLKKTS